MRGRDLHALFADCRGHVVQQAGAVAPVHLHDRVRVRRMIVDHHARRCMNGPHAAAHQAFLQLSNLSAQADAAGQCLLDQYGQTRQPVRRIERAAGGVLHPKRIQSHAVGHGVDARIDDRGTSDGQSAGNLAEQPGMVGAINRDLGHRAGR